MWFLPPIPLPVLHTSTSYRFKTKEKPATFLLKILWVLIKSGLWRLEYKSLTIWPLPLPSQTYHLLCTLLSASLSSLFPCSRWPLLKVFVLVWLHSQLVNSWNVTLVLLFPLKAGSCCLLRSQSHIHTSGPAPSGVIGQGSLSALFHALQCLAQVPTGGWMRARTGVTLPCSLSNRTYGKSSKMCVKEFHI